MIDMLQSIAILCVSLVLMVHLGCNGKGGNDGNKDN